METCHWASEEPDEKQEPIWIEAARLATPAVAIYMGV